MAQVCRPFRGRDGVIVAGLFLLLSACSPPAPENIPRALTPAETTVTTPPALPDTQPDAPRKPEPTWDAEPLSAWTVANRLAEFHATWTEFVAQSAFGPAAPDALVPYADAVAHQGESWGLSTDGPELVLVDTQGHAYHYKGGRHGLAPAAESREPLDAAVLSQWGWAALVSGEGLTVRYEGTQMEVLGALRADGACATCHDGSETELLGAMRYTFHEIADD